MVLILYQYGWGWRREVTLYSPGERNNVPKKWKLDFVGYDSSGSLCVIERWQRVAPIGSQ